ncbi:hypothetical protein Tco_0422149 [Tanacetum coccineum]
MIASSRMQKALSPNGVGREEYIIGLLRVEAIWAIKTKGSTVKLISKLSLEDFIEFRFVHYLDTLFSISRLEIRKEKQKLDGCGTYVAEKGATWSVVTSGVVPDPEVRSERAGARKKRLGSSCSKSNARKQYSFSSATSMKRLGEEFRTYLGNTAYSCLTTF